MQLFILFHLYIGFHTAGSELEIPDEQLILIWNRVLHEPISIA